MICKECGTKNVDWASYCTHCGRPLGWICHCTFLNQPEDLYCGGCGRQLSESIPVSLSISKKLNNSTPVDQQLTEPEIKKLIKESILLKVEKDNDVNQEDIDTIFKDK